MYICPEASIAKREKYHAWNMLRNIRMFTPSISFRLRRRFGTGWSAPLVKIATNYGASKVVAGLLSSQIRHIGDISNHKNASIRLLLLTKPGFTEDMVATFNGMPGIQLLTLDRTLIKSVYYAFLPPEVDDNNYRSAGSNFDKDKHALCQFWQVLWRYIFSTFNIHAVLTGNFGYFAEQEMASAAESAGIPFIAIHKECLKTEGLLAFYSELYRDRRQTFSGRLVCNYNQIERNLQIENNITSKSNNFVTGMPRLDFLHQWRSSFAGKPRLLKEKPKAVFMSFSELAGAPLVPHKGKIRTDPLAAKYAEISFPNLVTAFHAAAVETARLAPEAKIIIKSKNDVRSFAVLETTFGSKFKLPPNLQIISGGDPFDLITTADVVVGFNSTTLLEAVAAAVPVIVPRFSEAEDPRYKPYVMDLGTAVEHASSARDLIEQTVTYLTNRQKRLIPTQLTQESKRVLEYWLGNSDGLAGQRVKKVILDAIAANKHSRNHTPQ